MDQYCRMASRVARGILAKGCMGGQVGTSILGPPTAAVPGPVLSMKNSLHAIRTHEMSSCGLKRNQAGTECYFGPTHHRCCQPHPQLEEQPARCLHALCKQLWPEVPI